MLRMIDDSFDVDRWRLGRYDEMLMTAVIHAAMTRLGKSNALLRITGGIYDHNFELRLQVRYQRT